MDRDAIRDAVNQGVEKLLKSSLIPFPANNSAVLHPESHGVYVISHNNGNTLYVGRTVRGKRGLARRLTSHSQGASTLVKKYLNNNRELLGTEHNYQFIEIEDDRIRALVEMAATVRLVPEHFGLSQSRQVPVDEV